LDILNKSNLGAITNDGSDHTVKADEMPKIKSIVDIFGVNDSTSWVEDGFPSAKLFNKVYLQNTSTPHIPAIPMEVAHIENLPPTFIVGAKDKLLRSSKIWAERIGNQFKDVQFKIYEGADHGFFSFGKGCEELSDDMLAFFAKN
jgi:acetyl esterase/lipase